MKKHIFVGAVLLSLLTAGCSKEGILDNATEDVLDNDNEALAGKTITLQADIVDDFGTRMTYEDDATNKVLKFNWSDSESFKLYKDISSTGSLFSKSISGNIFSGTIPTGVGTYYAVYGDNITNTNGVLDVNIANQTGKTSIENGITTFMLAQTEQLIKTTGIIPSIDFKHKLAVLKLSLSLPSDLTGNVKRIEVSGLHNRANYTLSTNTYAYEDVNKGVISTSSFTIADNMIIAYVAVFPEIVAAKQVTITAYVGLKNYSYTITEARTLAEGEVVPVSVELVCYNDILEFTKDDFKSWNDDATKDLPTKKQFEMYLGAGVYWDNGSTTGDGYYNGNVQTYKVNGEVANSGLWMKKKNYIDGFDEGTAKAVNNVSDSYNKDCWHIGRPAKEDINKYFFLPAAGHTNYKTSYFYDNGKYGYYWSSDTSSSRAYLSFSSESASLYENCTFKCLCVSGE